MNNEPVAWMIKTLDGKKLMLYGKEQPPKFESEVQYIPLYTYPADESFDRTASHMAGEYVSYPAKTLTDEEIEDFTVRIYNCRTGAEAHEIVLAILRKAQE